MDSFGEELFDDVDNEDVLDDSDVSFKEQLIIMIDCQPNMFEQCNLQEKASPKKKFNEFQGLAWIEASLKVAASLQRSKIFQRLDDEIAICFYNTAHSKGHGGIEHVYLYQTLAVPDATRILNLQRLNRDILREKVGVGLESNRKQGLDHALWLAITEISEAQRSKTQARTIPRVLFLTRDPYPTSSFDESGSIKSRVEMLTNRGATIQLAPLIAPDQKFDTAKFWKPLFNYAHEISTTTMHPATQVKPAEVTQLTQGLEQLNLEDVESLLSIRHLTEVVRMRAYRKRAVTRMVWNLGPGGPAIGIKLYSTLQPSWPAVKGYASYVDAQTNVPLVADIAKLDAMTGIPLEVGQEPRQFYPKIDEKKVDRARFPRVYLTEEEIKSLKYPLVKGLSLQGFKPTSALKLHHQLRPATFVYPDESAIKGSNRTFESLYQAMLDVEVMAICTYVRNPSAEPRLVALVAQQETQDESGATVDPPGMHMIYLPFKDDIRYPERDVTFSGGKEAIVTPTEQQIEAAESLVDALSLADDFEPSAIPNPHLQRWFKVLENVVLRQAVDEDEDSEEEGEEEVPDDLTLPDGELFEAARPQMDAFVAACGGGLTGEKPKKSSTAGAKRKAAGGDDIVDVAGLNVPQRVADGALDKLTNDQLKAYLRTYGVPFKSNFRKKDLMEAVEKHAQESGASGAVKTEQDM